MRNLASSMTIPRSQWEQNLAAEAAAWEQWLRAATNGSADKDLAAANVTPQFRTVRGEAETLVDQFPPEHFHLVFCRNALEQCYDPLEAIRQMLTVVRPGCWVLLQQDDIRSDTERARGPWTLEE